MTKPMWIFHHRKAEKKLKKKQEIKLHKHLEILRVYFLCSLQSLEMLMSSSGDWSSILHLFIFLLNAI